MEMLAFILLNKLLEWKSKLSVKQKIPHHFVSVSTSLALASFLTALQSFGITGRTKGTSPNLLKVE